jgi:hypothetical protein
MPTNEANLPTSSGVLLVRTELDRILVRRDYADQVRRTDGCLDRLLYLDGDRVRDVTVSRSVLWPGVRWRSLVCDQLAIAKGRLPAQRTLAPRDGTRGRRDRTQRPGGGPDHDPSG